ncbi:MAG TPA: vanadium-dependent haloperoxidase [Pseudonocardiaceae bacterium]|nr:vanadium-dependent haloperoxidase [Pseudonocardiaceae bacterium]
MIDRRTASRNLRIQAAESEYARHVPEQLANGEEFTYPYVASYSKGLPHDTFGDVEPRAYRLLLRALATKRFEDFEQIPLGRPDSRRLTHPQAGLAFDLEGTDAQALTIPPAPRIDGPRNSAEMAELYWMALSRDVRFTDFRTDRVVAAAAADLSAMSDFRGPKRNGKVTPGTLFRGSTPGDLAGPFISQFLFADVPYWTTPMRQHISTVQAGVDYLTEFDEWLAVQNGAPRDPGRPSGPLRYLQTPRDLATYVHLDAPPYQAYLNANLILFGMRAPLDPGNPYLYSKNQEALVAYGPAQIFTLVAEVVARALKAIWYQKWSVHRRLRPEEFGGRVHLHKTGRRSYPMIDAEVLNSGALRATHEKWGTYLLRQAYPEGSPTHPAYGAGHAVIAGACVTVLKAWFDESYILPNPKVPNDAGSELVDYDGPDRGRLTVGGELNKLAANISTGRNIAGIHWRTDYDEAVTLGETVAIRLLREQQLAAHEIGALSLTRFDGTTVVI